MNLTCHIKFSRSPLHQQLSIYSEAPNNKYLIVRSASVKTSGDEVDDQQSCICVATPEHLIDPVKSRGRDVRRPDLKLVDSGRHANVLRHEHNKVHGII